MREPAPYPLQERQIVLPSGRMITLYNVIVFRGQHGAESVGLQYRTELPTEAVGERRAEAAELVALYAPPAAKEQLRRATAQICNTRAAAEMRERPEQILLFERDASGRWRYTGEDP